MELRTPVEYKHDSLSQSKAFCYSTIVGNEIWDLTGSIYVESCLAPLKSFSTLATTQPNRPSPAMPRPKRKRQTEKMEEDQFPSRKVREVGERVRHWIYRMLFSGSHSARET